MTTVASSVSGTATQWNGQGHTWIAPSGEAIAFYFDGTNWVYRTSSAAPYSSWSSASTVTGSLLAGAFAGYMDAATGNLHVAYKRTGGPLPTYRLFTKGGAGAGWSMGGAVNVATSGDYGNDAAAPHITLDLSGRIWIMMTEWVGGYAGRVFYSADGSSWTNYFNGDERGLSASSAHVAPCFNGGTQYMLVMDQRSGNVRWRRAQTSGGSVGVISSAQTVGTFSTHDDHSSDMVGMPDGRVLLAVAPAGGGEFAIRTLVYTPSSDTWAYSTGAQATSDIGSGTSDKWPALAVNPTTGTVYCVWSEFSSSNNYAVVYREFTPGTNTWGSKVTLQAAGADRIYDAAGCDGVSLLGTVTNATSSLVECFVATVGTPPAAGGAVFAPPVLRYAHLLVR